MDSQELVDLLYEGRLTVIPLGIASVIVFAIVLERLWRFRGIDKRTRGLTREVIDVLVRRDLDGARSLCEKATTPISVESVYIRDRWTYRGSLGFRLRWLPVTD